MARGLIAAGHFVEVHLNTPLAVCEQRDVNGLHRSARAGQIPNMTGVNSLYEAPDCEIDTSSESLEALIERLS